MNFQKRTIYLKAEQQRETLLALVRNLPLDNEKPLQVTIEEFRQPRKLDQNALMWAGPLSDISEQGYLQGKRFSAEAWHEMFKIEFLPEEFDPVMCRDKYKKWEYTPAGERVMVGSTSMLTVKGFALYLEQVMAFGANIGVQFHANPNERQS
jgi:hypothetical protein